MPAPRALFIGGTGVISSACTDLAVREGWDVTAANRGTGQRPLPEGVRPVVADVRDPAAFAAAIDGETFDVVVNFVAFTREHVQSDVDLLRGRTGQYVFISSASAYNKPPAALPIRESTPLRNPYWRYSRDKIAAELALMDAYREDGFPVTIVRPSHTYDATKVPLAGGWTAVERMRQGKKVVVHGDGSSLWTLTHHTDFARGFVPLLGSSRALGEAYTITGDDVLSWDQITQALARAAGTVADIVHVPSDQIAALDPEWGDSLLGDKTWSTTFDTSKVRELAPDLRTTVRFEQGAREIVAWHDADPARRVVDVAHDQLQDLLVERFAVSS